MNATWAVRAALAVAALVPSLAALAAPEPAPEPASRVVKDRDSFIPKRKYAALKGTTVGVLVSDVKAMMAQEGRGGPPDAMGFSAGGNSYRWIYVPALQGRPMISNLQVNVGEKPGKIKTYPALNMANAAEVKRWDIDVAYALVEVEVNDGEGSPAQEGFVATKMKRLDGTARYPLKLPDVVGNLRKRYQAHVKVQQKKIDREMESVQKKVLKGRKVTGPRQTGELMYLTWLPDSKRVRLAFRTRIDDGAFQEATVGRGRPIPLPPPPKPGKEKALAFRPPPPPREFKVKYGVSFGVELGLAYEVDIKGKVVATHELPPQSFSREIPPPPGAKLK
jgi:hypothetical protein